MNASKSDKTRWFWMLVLQPERTSSLQRPTVWSIFRLRQVSCWNFSSVKTDEKYSVCAVQSFTNFSSAPFQNFTSFIFHHKSVFRTRSYWNANQRPVCLKEKVNFTQVFISVSWDSYARVLTVASLCFKVALLLPSSSLFTKKDPGLFIRGV